MIKAIIFDLDDTLIQTSQAKYKALQHAAKRFYDLELSDEDIRSHWGKPFETFMHDLFRGAEETEVMIKKYYSVRNDFPTSAYEDSKKMLLTFREKYQLGVVTAATLHMTVEDLSMAGLSTTMFDYIQTCDDTIYHKPDPKVFEPLKQKFALSNIGVDELLYVGDALTDAMAAQGASIRFVGISKRTTPAIEFDNLGIEHVSNLEELERLLPCFES